MNTRTDGRRLQLAVSLWPTGRHETAWRSPDARVDGEFNPAFYTEIARIAERGVFDYFFLGNNQASKPADGRHWITGAFKPEAFTACAYLAAVTSHIGLVPTFNATYSQPYDVARLSATLDHFSRGRAGLNLVTGKGDTSDDMAQNFGRSHHLDGDSRYDLTEEFTQILLGLWGSWDTDWQLADKGSGRYLRPEAAHVLDFRGEHFSVRGPLNAPRPPQGHIPLVHAGGSERSFEFGAEYADVRFVYFRDTDWNVAHYADLKSRLAKYGRSPDRQFVVAGVNFYVAESTREARERFLRAQELVLDPYDATALGALLGVELADIDPASRVWDVVDRDRLPGTAWVIDRAADAYGRDDITLEQLHRLEANDAAYVGSVVGSGRDIADWIERNFEERAFDGVKVFPLGLPHSLEAFVDLVVPELQRRGLARSEYTTTTLRGHLGLDVPEPRRGS